LIQNFGIIFQNSLEQYFKKIKLTPPQIYLNSFTEKFQFLEFSSLIVFSGSQKGFCLVTADIHFLQLIGYSLLQEKITEPDILHNLISEFANGISANASRDMQDDYDILPPIQNMEKILEVIGSGDVIINQIIINTDHIKCMVYIGHQ
jgi:hypothetical protein